MKVAIVLVLYVLVGSNEASIKTERIQPFLFENEIQNVIEEFRQFLINGVPALGIPSFDPLNVSALNINLGLLDNPNYSGTVAVRNFTLQGIAGFDRPDLQISVTIIPVGFKLRFAINWPRIVLAGNYDINANIMGRNIVGEGPIMATFTNTRVNISAQAQFSTSTMNIRISKLQVGSSVENVEFQMGSLAVDGTNYADIITNFMNSLPQRLADAQQGIQILINDFLQWFNNILS